MERTRIIVITPQERDYLMKQFGCSYVSVYDAVKYRKNNLLHKKIRKAAIERGNPQMVLTPEFDTIYITNRKDADKNMTRYMVQTFENGATLEGNFSTGIVEIRDNNGEVKGKWNNPQISEMGKIQEQAMNL
ncbi:MAG: hypothetical protein ACI4BC_04470 [Muribaculaceae bacterium]